MAFALAAMVAMPERHLPVTWRIKKLRVDGPPGVYRASASARRYYGAILAGDRVFVCRGAPLRLSSHPAQRFVHVHDSAAEAGLPWPWQYRDAGLHVLLGGLWE